MSNPCFNGRTSNDSALLIAEVQQTFDNLKETKNFNRVAKDLKVLSASPESLLVEFTVSEEYVNGKGTLHGGQTAALVDIVTARAIGITVRDVPMVSLDISVSYMLPARVGEVITVEAVCLKIGRNVGYSEAIFRRKADGALIAKGRHNIYFLNHLKAKNGEVINQF